MPQNELGEFLEVTNAMVSAYEKGRALPRFEGVIKMAEFFEVNLDDFVYKDLSQEKDGITKVDHSSPTNNEETVESLTRVIVRLENDLQKVEGEYKGLVEKVRKDAVGLGEKWGV